MMHRHPVLSFLRIIAPLIYLVRTLLLSLFRKKNR